MRLALPLALATLSLAACASDPEPEAPEPAPALVPEAVDDSVAGIVGTNGQLTTLGRALEAAGLADTLRGANGVYTLFAPSDAAFNALPDGALDALLADTDRLRTVLNGHVVPTRMLSPDVIDGLTIESLAGTDLTLAADGATVRVRDAGGTTAEVTTSDLDTANGVVHVVDAVLGL